MFEEARPMLENCLDRDPNDVGCLDGMVTQYVRDGDLEAAERLANRMRDLAPKTTSAYLAYGQIADHSGDIPGAIRAYEGACSKGQKFACTTAEKLRQGRK
jgi:DNA-binding SARP family transcriptional activator